MRLFIATGIFHPESGGPATYLHGFLPQALAAGHDVRLLTFGDPTPTDAAYGYPLRRIPRRAFYLRPLAYAQYALAARAPQRWADLTYIHSLGLPLGAPRGPRVMKIVGDLAWERAVRRGWIPPDEDIDAFQTTHYGPLVERFKRARAHEAARMDRVIVPSAYLKCMVVGWGVAEARVQVIYNALRQAEASALSQAEARAALDLPAGPLLLTVARLTAWKGVGPLITAVARTPGVRLLVAGDGPLLAELKQQAAQEGVADRVTFLGRQPRERVATLMRAADYVALYSGYEGLSHTLLEALQAGTPVIASDKGGNPEVVRHGHNGLLVPYADQAALTAAVGEAFAPGLRDHLAAHAGDGLDRFTWARMVDETLAALTEVGAQHAAPLGTSI